MDCNKDEAIKVLDLAEKKFKANDFEGAVNLALKAQELFPSLSNLIQTLTAYQVHLAVSATKNTDWYSVLGTDRSADFTTIKKQFKKMCLLTHPDKNRRSSSASDGAFKMVVKAWSILSAGTNRSSSSSSSKTNHKKSTCTSTVYLYVKIRCEKCGLLCFWDFSSKKDGRRDGSGLFHYCKICSRWGTVRVRPAKADVPPGCEGCDGSLRWGFYRPLGFECELCCGYYVAGVNPEWIADKFRGSDETCKFRPGTVACPYCGAWNEYKVVDDGGDKRCIASCKLCGLRSIIEVDFGKN